MVDTFSILNISSHSWETLKLTTEEKSKKAGTSGKTITKDRKKFQSVHTLKTNN